MDLRISYKATATNVSPPGLELRLDEYHCFTVRCEQCRNRRKDQSQGDKTHITGGKVRGFR